MKEEAKSMASTESGTIVWSSTTQFGASHSIFAVIMPTSLSSNTAKDDNFNPNFDRLGLRLHRPS